MAPVTTSKTVVTGMKRKSAPAKDVQVKEIQGDDEIRDLIVPEFYGHVRRLIKHPEAGWILDDIYRGVGYQAQKAIILREWYGAEFAVMERDTPSS
ncbi:hypothetical protein DID88_001357 [Monilinia fructigena]|uniref:Uncharacterized protein n=1 Tax=Monilinia fructigena TaxID=38457 RepID=A0A395IYL2_9HELO|nr:hypothetical protein DID88_001357 [Monilinia fructigena]